MVSLRRLYILNVEILMGHDIGLVDSYYGPSEQELLKDYLTSVDLLTVLMINQTSKTDDRTKKRKAWIMNT